MSYKEILGTPNRFYEEPTYIIMNALSNDMILSLGRSLSERKSYHKYKEKNTHEANLRLARDLRDIFDEYLIAGTTIDADDEKFENGLQNLIYWAFDMIDWLGISSEIFYTYEEHIRNYNHSNGQDQRFSMGNFIDDIRRSIAEDDNIEEGID